jgi:hypothetical protein
MLEKDGEYQLDQLCEKWSTTYSQGRQEHPTYYKKKKRKATWIGYMYSRNCLLEHVVEGLIEGRIKVTEKTRNKT